MCGKKTNMMMMMMMMITTTKDDIYYYDNTGVLCTVNKREGFVIHEFDDGVRGICIQPSTGLFSANHTRIAIIKINGEWFIHNDTSHAVVGITGEKRYYLFYHMGYNFKIEDLPISSEDKTYLRLKYEEYHHGEEPMLWYT